MGYLVKYKKSDFVRLSWKEYFQILDNALEKLSKYLKENKIKIDAVVAILRGGAFPAAYITYKLNLLRILPVQYKYFFVNKKIELRKIFEFPKSAIKKSKPTFLLVENNHCFGLIAEIAARDLKKRFPNCKVIYVAEAMDYSYRKNKYADKIFYGKLTNETKKLTKEQIKRIGIKNFCNLFPWESMDEEWSSVSSKQFEYGDLSETFKISKKKLVIE